MPYPWLNNISGNEKIYVWIFLIGMLLWWAYSEGFFSSIINKSKESDKAE
jgi:hypothetical protein